MAQHAPGSGIPRANLWHPDLRASQMVHHFPEEYIHEVLWTGISCHLVTAGGNPVGLITLHGVRAMPRDKWGNTSMQAVMLPLDRIHSATPEERALSVLDRTQKEDINQMPITSEGHIVGVIARDTILGFLQTRLQLEHFAEQ